MRPEGCRVVAQPPTNGCFGSKADPSAGSGLVIDQISCREIALQHGTMEN